MMDDSIRYDETVGLLVTYRCNLQCRYCYITRKRPQDMSLERAKNVLRPYLEKEKGRLEIVFMGAEILMAENTIRALVEWVQAGNWKRDFHFFGCTNGTLLTEDFKRWLTTHRDAVCLGLSYDGLPAVQNQNRGGADSIDLDFFRRTWPQQQIQMTIDEHSVSSMAEGVIFLLEKGFRVNPNVAYEKKQWSPSALREYGLQIRQLLRYYLLHPDTPLIPQLSHPLCEYARYLTKPARPMRPCGAGDGFRVYDVDGKAYPCHMLSPLVLSRSQIEAMEAVPFHAIDDFADARCAECPYVSACPTCMGCNFIYRYSFQKRDATHCAITQLEVQATLKYELSRLMGKETLSPADALSADAILDLYQAQTSGKLRKKYPHL